MTASYAQRANAFLLAEKPRGFSQLNRQNQIAIIKFIDVLLDFQDNEWHGGVDTEISPGSVITQIKPRPILKIQIAE